MLIALFADIHGNREALTACLADAERAGAERYVFLGDLVGYGADPAWVVDRAAEMVEAGAVAVLGNHDAAVLNPSEGMNAAASAAIDWTRTRLDHGQQSFLAELPLTVEEGDRLFVHASASAPRYLDLRVQPARGLPELSGDAPPPHLLRPYALSGAVQRERQDAAAAATCRRTTSRFRCLGQRRWLAVLGAVGQPRDRNPAACYGLFDDARNRLTYVRVPYDVELAARKIRKAGLPEFLAERLTMGI